MNFLRRFVLFLAMAGILFSGVLAADGVTHVVRRGETIYSISRLYSVSPDEVMRSNNITNPSSLQVGRRLVIPSSGAAVPSSVSPAPTQALSDYRVVRGDTLYGIARTNEISLQTLLEINRFPSNHVIRVGDTIKVPARSSGTTQPTVTTADTSPQRETGLYALRWPVTPRDIAYMTGQMGVVVEGEQSEVVRSLTQGKVISAGPWRKFGRVVIVETAGGYLYMYGGCESLSVSVGDRLSPGAELGKLGINAVSEKPQLFFMVFRSDTPIDPALAPRAGNLAISRDNIKS